MSDAPGLPVGVVVRGLLWLFGQKVGGWDEPQPARFSGRCLGCYKPIRPKQQIRGREVGRAGREYRHDWVWCLVR